MSQYWYTPPCYFWYSCHSVKHMQKLVSVASSTSGAGVDMVQMAKSSTSRSIFSVSDGGKRRMIPNCYRDAFTASHNGLFRDGSNMTVLSERGLSTNCIDTNESLRPHILKIQHYLYGRPQHQGGYHLPITNSCDWVHGLVQRHVYNRLHQHVEISVMGEHTTCISINDLVPKGLYKCIFGQDAIVVTTYSESPQDAT